MTQTASDFLIKRISEWRLKRIYGYPGDGINGIMGGLDRANGAIEYVHQKIYRSGNLSLYEPEI